MPYITRTTGKVNPMHPIDELMRSKMFDNDPFRPDGGWRLLIQFPEIKTEGEAKEKLSRIFSSRVADTAKLVAGSRIWDEAKEVISKAGFRAYVPIGFRVNR